MRRSIGVDRRGDRSCIGDVAVLVLHCSPMAERSGRMRRSGSSRLRYGHCTLFYLHIGSLDAIQRFYKRLSDRVYHNVELEYYYRLYSIEYGSGSGVTAGAGRRGKYNRRAGRRGRCSYVTVCI
jgi:hypothetical protein